MAPTALVQCVALAEPWPIDGLHMVGDFADEVRDLYHGRGSQPLSTGFREMDKAFRFEPGQFIVVTGIPNHGKSRWLDQVAVQSARMHGDAWAVFSPETGDANHIADLCAIWSGYPFHEGQTPRMTEAELDDAIAWIRSRFSFIASKDATPSIEWVLERAKAAVIRQGVRHLIIDPYNEIEASRPAKLTETEYISTFIAKCKRFAAHHDVTVCHLGLPHCDACRAGDLSRPDAPRRLRRFADDHCQRRRRLYRSRKCRTGKIAVNAICLKGLR